MALSVSVIQAAENALAAWIRAQLPDVVVSDEWPDPGVAFDRRGEVTLLRAGRSIERPVRPVQLVASVLDPFQPMASFTWRTHAIEQPLQLDVWTTSKPKRDDILNRLATALTA